MDLFTIAVGIIGSRDLTEEILSEVMTILATLAPGEASALESVKNNWNPLSASSWNLVQG